MYHPNHDYIPHWFKTRFYYLTMFIVCVTDEVVLMSLVDTNGAVGTDEVIACFAEDRQWLVMTGTVHSYLGFYKVY